MSKDQKEREIARVYRVRKTLLKMLSDRHYLVSVKELEATLDDFIREFNPMNEFDRERLAILAQNKDDPTDQIMVFFPSDPQLGMKIINVYIEKMKQIHCQRAIIVYKGKITGFAKQLLNESKSIELFNEEELLVNITEHSLVPKHVVLTEDEKKQLLARYRLKDSQLPRIQEHDPIARYYGIKRGQVVKIIRPSETAGRYVTYRIVF